MNTFLDALKKKSAIEQLKLATDSNTNFEVKSGLQAQAIEKMFQAMPDPAPTVRIERVLDKNRIDVYFREKPSNDVLQALKDRCFSWSPEGLKWYNKDTLLNRVFLADLFNAPNLVQAESKPEVDTESKDTPLKTEQAINSFVEAHDSDDYPIPSFEDYKNQIEALKIILGCDFADLPLIAINHLHRSVTSC